MRQSGLARNSRTSGPLCGIVPNDVDEAFVGVARLDLGEKLRRAHPVHRGGLDKGRIEILKVQRTWMFTRPRPEVVVTAGFEPALTQP